MSATTLSTLLGIVVFLAILSILAKRRFRRSETKYDAAMGGITILDCLSEATRGSEIALEVTCDEVGWNEWWEKIASDPADVFGIASVLAHASGAYACVTNNENSSGREKVLAADAVDPQSWFRDQGALLRSQRLEDSRNLDVETQNTIMNLMVMSDMQFGNARWGAAQDASVTDLKRLAEKGSLSRLDPARVRVLPKFRTPQVGLTVRSWSHHLAALVNEVPVTYRQVSPRLNKQADDETYTILLCPWPVEVSSRDFKALEDPGRDFGYFSFEPDNPFDKGRFEKLVQASNKMGPVDLTVFPESALDASGFDAAFSVLESEDGGSILAGVREHRRNSVKYCDGIFSTAIQTKHHRWKLDEEQIIRYQLGDSLAPHKDWWEDIQVDNKGLIVLDTGRHSIVPLVCEDLARQDSVTPMIRTLGPSLVVALLLDGPQLAGRWSGRYASILAEDPGSSVLSVTSIGMVMASTPPFGKPKSRAVALWRSPEQSEATPIILEEGAAGLRLTLRKRPVTEKTVDGRDSSEHCGWLYLSDVTQVFCEHDPVEAC